MDSSTESPTNSFVELILTCSSWQEAHDIAEVLLKKGLIATAEFLPVPSRHHRLKRAFEKTEEIKLIMRSISAYYSGIETAITTLRGKGSFSLQTAPVAIIDGQTMTWLNNNTQGRQLAGEE